MHFLTLAIDIKLINTMALVTHLDWKMRYRGKKYLHNKKMQGVVAKTLS